MDRRSSPAVTSGPETSVRSRNRLFAPLRHGSDSRSYSSAARWVRIGRVVLKPQPERMKTAAEPHVSYSFQAEDTRQLLIRLPIPGQEADQRPVTARSLARLDQRRIEQAAANLITGWRIEPDGARRAQKPGTKAEFNGAVSGFPEMAVRALRNTRHPARGERQQFFILFVFGSWIN